MVDGSADAAARAHEVARRAGVTLRSDAASRNAADEDFGRIARGASLGVLEPRDANDVARAVGAAAELSVGITPKGMGYSAGGQSLSRGGLVLDLRRLDRVESVSAGVATVACEAGASLQRVAGAAMAAGMLPRGLPLNLDMTVGGLLSAGGVGAECHRFGPTVSNVAALEVVTADGRARVCDRENEPELFHAALGGVGQFGVITRATLALRAVKPRVRTFQLVYDAPDRWLADALVLAKSARFDAMEGFLWAGAKGTRSGPRGRRPFAQWLYGLHASVEYAGGAPEEATALAGLSPWRVLHTDDENLSDFVTRYEGRYGALHRSGAWHQSHPWLECFVPLDRFAGVLTEVLDRLPLSLGDGHRMFLVRTAGAPEMLALPAGELAALFAVLPGGVPALLRSDATSAIRDVAGILQAAGATRYLSGWLDPPGRDGWNAHLGARAERWALAKRAYDPGGVFGSVFLGGGSVGGAS